MPQSDKTGTSQRTHTKSHCTASYTLEFVEDPKKKNTAGLHRLRLLSSRWGLLRTGALRRHDDAAPIRLEAAPRALVISDTALSRLAAEALGVPPARDSAEYHVPHEAREADKGHPIALRDGEQPHELHRQPE